MAHISFDDIAEAVDKEYDHLSVGFDDRVVTFRNVLQLDKDKRDQIGELLKKLGDDDESDSDESPADDKPDSEDVMREILRTAADDADACDAFLAKVGENAARLLHTFKAYIGSTEVPEA